MMNRAMIILAAVFAFAVTVDSFNVYADSTNSRSPLKVLASKEPQEAAAAKKKINPSDVPMLTVGEFFLQQFQQFQTIRTMMEQQMSQHLSPSSPMYQKMLQMNQLRMAMFNEFVALTAGDERPLSTMMDPKSGLHQHIKGVQQKYEVQINQLEAELGPYIREHMMEMQSKSMTSSSSGSSIHSEDGDHTESNDFENSGTVPPSEKSAEN